VVEEAELLAVVGAAHEARGAARVAVVPPAVCRAVTVSLSVLTRVTGGAAPPPVVVATPASLVCIRLSQRSGHVWGVWPLIRRYVTSTKVPETMTAYRQ